MKLYLSAVVVLAVAFAAKETAAEIRYHVTWLGDFSGISPVAINDMGQVAGTRILAGKHHGFLWQNGVSIDLGGFEYPGSLVHDVNNLGQVVGINPGSSARPLVWKADEAWTPLPGSLPEPSSLFSPHYYHSIGINDRNQVVVLADFPLETFIHSYLYDAGTWTGLGERPYPIGPVFKTWANGLNEIGEVVGYSVFPGRLGLKRNQAMMWRNGQAQQLPALSGFEGSVATAINESSVVVGQSEARGILDLGTPYPTVWFDSVPQELPMPPGHSGGSATAINDINQIVGQSSPVNFSGNRRAIFWEDGQAYDLNSISDISPGTYLDRALDINNAGQIVGQGIGPSGLWGTFLLTPTALQNAPEATLDLGDNFVIGLKAGTGSVAAVREQIISGRGGPGMGTTWTGTGITSSAAAAAVAADPESRSIGYADNSAMPLGPYTTFRGQPVDETSILVDFTRTGDANLDGLVNDDDVTIVGATYAPGVPQPSWALGDFDYNGFVDDDDVTLLGVFYDPSAQALSLTSPRHGESRTTGGRGVASAAAPEADAMASGVTTVPEPGSALLLVTGLIGILMAAALRRKTR